MTLSSTMYCPDCKMNRDVLVHAGKFPRRCDECEEVATQRLEDEHLIALRVLTIEERLAIIEKRLYRDSLGNTFYTGPFLVGDNS